MIALVLAAAALTPTSLAGPHESLAAYCAAQPDPERCLPDVDGQDQVGDDRPVGQSDRRGDGSIRRARVFVDEDACRLAIEVQDGWYVQDEELELCDNSGSARPRFRITELALRDVVGSRDADLVLRFRIDFLHAFDGWHRRDVLVVCGVGDGGVPSCLPPIDEEVRWRCLDRVACESFEGGATPRRGALRTSFVKRKLVVKKRKGPLTDRQRAARGRHAITWR